MISTKAILDKYGDIIKEELNIKDIALLEGIEIKKIFKPIGGQLSVKFGKDTGQIIANGKQGNIEEIGNGKIKVFDDQGKSRELEDCDYEITYEGIDGENMAIEGDIITQLDLEITPELAQEGIAREISRFLNQMRKDADYAVNTKVDMIYQTENQNYKTIVDKFSNFLEEEALLVGISKSKDPEGDIKAIFEHQESTIIFALKK